MGLPPTPFLRLLLETDSARYYGFFAIAAMGFIFLAGVAWCGVVMRRPTTNRKGLLSLIFALTAYFGALIIGYASQESLAVKEWRAITIGVFASGFLATLVTAVWALVEIARNPGRFKQGSVQSFISLLIVSAVTAQGVYMLIFGKST